MTMVNDYELFMNHNFQLYRIYSYEKNRIQLCKQLEYITVFGQHRVHFTKKIYVWIDKLGNISTFSMKYQESMHNIKCLYFEMDGKIIYSFSILRLNNIFLKKNFRKQT